MKLIFNFKQKGFVHLTLLILAAAPLIVFLTLIFLGPSIGIEKFGLLSFLKHGQESKAAGTGRFEIQGNKIIDPNGAQFIVKGMTPIYGPFAGGDDQGTWSTYSLNNAASIFADLKTNWSGVNLVRIFTSGGAANGHGPSDWNLPNYKNLLFDVVQKARNQGFVVLLVNSYSNITDTRSWIKELALKYKDDPYIWITPSNEPFCTSPDSSESSHCSGGNSEWQYWQANTNNYISDIRSQGFHNPILINSIQWSWDLSQIGTYTLADSDNRLIYGAHRYANDNTTFSTAEQNNTNSSWANLAAVYPIVADEIGNYNGGLTQFTWLQGITDFVANWVNTRQGDGMIAFNHYWSDGNSQTTDGIHPNTWGNYYLNNYLKKVTSGAVVAPPSPTPTSAPSVNPSTSPSGASYFNTVKADGPVGYWRLGEKSGTTAANSMGSSLQGSFISSPGLGQSGALTGDSDSSVLFNGTSSYMNIPYNAALNPAGAFSFESWVYPTSTSTSYKAVAASRSYPRGWTIYKTDRNTWSFWINSGSSMINVNGPSIAVNAWTHLVATFDGSTARLYVNGSQVATGSTSGYAPNTSSSLVVGQGEVGSGFFFAGRVDEVSLYNKALSASQVSSHYNSGKNGGSSPATPTPSLIPVPVPSSLPSPVSTPLSSPVSLGGTLYGNATVGNGTDYSDDLQITALKISVPSSGHANEIAVYVGKLPSQSGKISGAIYSDNGGKPGTLIWGSGSQNLTAAGWNRITVPNVSLSAGTYWVGFNASNATTGFNFSVSQTNVLYQEWLGSFGTWPQQAPSPQGGIQPYNYNITVKVGS